MSIDPDNKGFTEAIGAKEPSPGSKDYTTWKAIFKRSNYFLFNGKLIIVKVSRSKKPFWGIGKDIIDLLNSFGDYYLVLLASSREGWVFTKNEVNARIRSKTWNLRDADNNYKINYPLPHNNSFLSPEDFQKKFGALVNNNAP